MTRQRKPETYQGIVGESIVRDYDEMQRASRPGTPGIGEIIGSASREARLWRSDRARGTSASNG